MTPPRRHRSALILVLPAALAGCWGPTEFGEWGTGSGPSFCTALSRADDGHFVAVQLGRTGNQSGIAITAPELEEAVATGAPGAVLTIDGSPVRAPASPGRFRDVATLTFNLDARRLLARHSAGMTLGVQSGGNTLYQARLTATAPAWQRLQRCDQGIPVIRRRRR